MENKLKQQFTTLRRFSQVLMTELIDNPSGRKFDLKLSQLNAISAFKDERPLTMNELAENGMVKLPNMTTMVERLVEEGFIVRKKDPADRRKVLVSLTPKGKKIRKQFLNSRREKTISTFANLSPNEKKELLNSMEKVCSLLEKSIEKNKLPSSAAVSI